jgi:serine phosphatase RsbU (regulator of sigma subunit)/anti-sigma regulatory factor (Ser/Thr protein kinase)/type II secretory pathway pseudopilin PulG
MPLGRRRRAEPLFEEVIARSARGLRGRLVVGALVALGVLVTLALVFVWQQYQDSRRQAARDLQSRAVLAATVFDTYFTGQLQALSAIAASPSVRAADTKAMARYFSGFRPGSGTTFTAGVGWIDLTGRQRATSAPNGPISINLADRDYFSRVVATGKPYVADAIVARTSKRRLIVIAVPTRRPDGRLSGVLAGGFVLPQSRRDPRASDLGYAGLSVIDRKGQQITRRDLASPANAALLRQVRAEREGVLVGTDGLDGSGGRVVAFATSQMPGWKAVLDQPESVVFADARRALLLEGSLVVAAALCVLALIAWALRRSRRDLLAAQAQVRRWAQLIRSLNAAVDKRQVADLVATAVATEFRAGTAIVDVEGGKGESAHVTAFAHGRHSPFAGLDERRTVALARPFGSDGEPGGGVRASTPGVYAIALGAPPGRAGTLAVVFAHGDALDADQQTLLQAHAEQASQALDRVRRHEEEHDLAVLLQESLLPGELGEPDGLEIASFYRAGALHAAVGGDWYDLVRRPDGIVLLTVGDVAGHGIEAAVTMGQLRNAFRAYALEHESPAAVVLRVAHHAGDDGMATMLCVAIDPYTRELSYASAGHPPALLLDPVAKHARRLEESVSGPLGWVLPASGSDVPVDAPANATLAMYTDGLVERRDEPLDQGIDRLAAALLGASTSTPQAAVRAIVDEMFESRNDDDLALLLVRLNEVPGSLEIQLPARPDVLRGLRRRVRAWLVQRGIDEEAREAAVLAMTEACNNAIEHGYRESSGTITVRFRDRGDTLVIAVEDTGSWREPQPDPTRGRGFVLMQHLMETTEVVHKPTGTEVVLEQRLRIAQ